MEEFWSVLLQCGLVDLGFHGNIFIWRNERSGEAFVQERLDRACATIEWKALLPCSKVTHLQASYSDHDPIMFTTNMDTQGTRKKKIPKRFEENWATHLNVRELFMKLGMVIPTGSPICRLFEKIKKSRMSLVG